MMKVKVKGGYNTNQRGEGVSGERGEEGSKNKIIYHDKIKK